MHNITCIYGFILLTAVKFELGGNWCDDTTYLYSQGLDDYSGTYSQGILDR